MNQAFKKCSIITPDSIQIYQALRKDSGNYISEEDWHISISFLVC